MEIVEKVTHLLEGHKGFNGTGDPYMDILKEWEIASELLALVKDIEMDRRKKLFAGAFPNPKEGTNTHVLPDGRHIKGQYTIRRNIDEAALPGVLEDLRKRGVANTDALVRYKPELAKREWNSLSDENKLAFSPAVIAVPGTPSFDVVIPKKRGRKS